MTTGTDIANAVQAVMGNGVDYTASGDTTHCSEFVRDFWTRLGLLTTTDLAGQANDQVTALKTSANWGKFALNGATNDDLQGVFNAADSAASAGAVVLMGWLNPDWTGAVDTDHDGHIAIIVPSVGDDLQTSTTWPNLQLPFSAQAGPAITGLGGGSVFAEIKLSWGFGSDKKSGMTIFTNTNMANPTGA